MHTCKLRTYQLFGIVALATSLLSGQSHAADWWSMPDIDFVKQYQKLAVGTPQEQSKFAWMLFARINQPTELGGKMFSRWETWPSNLDTFSPIAPEAFIAAKKIRTRPHLQESKAFKLHLGIGLESLNNGVPTAQEEVTRNTISFNYIRDKARPLNTRGGLLKALADKQKIELPLGSVEIKAVWDFEPIDGAYQITDGQTIYSLRSIHIMAKIAPTPADPFASPDASWFWTTFEFKDNPNLAAALKFVTYPNTLTATDISALLAEAKLDKTNFGNYVSNGTQLRFIDSATKKPIVLGNTKMEAFAFVPSATPPWTGWNSSCHTCHGTSSGFQKNNKWSVLQFGTFSIQTGNIKNMTPNSKAIDFNWSIPIHAR